MMTTGQRIKLFRKNKGFTQAETAERIGVSVQTVSKWECDGGMPDISQIVPLAKVLGVTTDSILGMGGSEEDDIAEVQQMVNDMWSGGHDNQSADNRSCDQNRTEYLAKRELVRKYPLNYGIAVDCAWEGAWYLRSAVRNKYFEMTDGEVQSLFTELTRMLTSVISYDRDLPRQIAAHRCLARIYSIVGDYDKADREAELLPDDKKLIAQYFTASDKKLADGGLELESRRELFSDGKYTPTDTNLAKMKEKYLWNLVMCHDECADKTGNPVVTSPRFQALVKRIESL